METFAVVFSLKSVLKERQCQGRKPPRLLAPWSERIDLLRFIALGLAQAWDSLLNLKQPEILQERQTMHPCLGITFPVTDLQITATPERPRNSPNQCQTCFCIHLSLLCERNQWLHVISPLGSRRCCDVHMKHLVAFHSAFNTHSCHRKGAKWFLCTNILERMW